MGLDMYLYTNSKVLAKKVADEFYLGEAFDYDWCKRKGMIGYWRKVSGLHNWFVENVQDSEDDCKFYKVTYEDLNNLYKEVKRANQTKDFGELYPVQGFFFNPSDIEEWNWTALEYTERLLKFILDNIVTDDRGWTMYEADEPDWELKIFYNASW